jgi:hypothetical protein
MAFAWLLAACTTAPMTNDRATRPWHSVPIEDVRITAERTTDDRQDQHVVIHGDGVAIWNNSIQFRVEKATIRQILAAFDAADFGTIPERSPKGKFLRRRASIRAGNYEREAWETWESELERQSERETIRRSKERKGIVDEELDKEPPLTTLVDSIIEAVLPIVGKGGTTAESLEDGLKKVASGELAPETLSVTMLIRPEPGRSDDSRGFLLKIEDAIASRSEFRGEQLGFADAGRVKLKASQVRDLAARLASFHPGSLPINLYSPRYEEVTVSVLNRRNSIVARQFAGLTAAKHGEAQTRFDAMVSLLSSTVDQWFAQRR